MHPAPYVRCVHVGDEYVAAKPFAAIPGKCMVVWFGSETHRSGRIYAYPADRLDELFSVLIGGEA
jgi:hypothetical protein